MKNNPQKRGLELAANDAVSGISSPLIVSETAAYAEKLLAEQEITLADVLAGLDEVGEELYNELYGDIADD